MKIRLPYAFMVSTIAEIQEARRRAEEIVRRPKCKQCGINVDLRTPSCKGCYNRHRNRRIRKEMRMALAEIRRK